MYSSLRQAAGKFVRRVPSPTKSLFLSRPVTTNPSRNSLASEVKYSYKYGSGECSWRLDCRNPYLWTIIVGQAALVFGITAETALADASPPITAENDSGNVSITGLRRVEDGSVKSNEHTSKWRVFTDSGRDFFLKGNLDQAERFFLSALKEAKEGFGQRDPHVASAYNNLAELYRVKMQFDKAEPLYLEAITILDESFGSEDIRVATALHNLGQFYLMQRKLEEARKSYERAVKIKRRVLGLNHMDYADTLYHLGRVLYFLGEEKDVEALIQESIRILEENGQGESSTCVRRLRHLAQMYKKINRLAEAENTQKKVLHIMEVSKRGEFILGKLQDDISAICYYRVKHCIDRGWKSLQTVIAAEELALIQQAIGNLNEAEDLLQRCLQARKTLLSKDHIQIGANMLHIARVAMLHSDRLRKLDTSKAIAELEKANVLLDNSIRIGRQILNKLRKPSTNMRRNEASGATIREGRVALIILMQSLNGLAIVEVSKQELLESKGEHFWKGKAENAMRQCISSYKEFEAESWVTDSPEVKLEYLSCLKRLLEAIELQELKDEVQRIEAQISDYRKKN